MKSYRALRVEKHSIDEEDRPRGDNLVVWMTGNELFVSIDSRTHMLLVCTAES
jgi:hypothetical protein